MHALFKSTHTRERKIVSNTHMYSKRKSKNVSTLSKDPNHSTHQMEAGRHRWYSSFCDAYRHMQGHTTQLKSSFKPEGDNTGRTD